MLCAMCTVGPQSSSLCMFLMRMQGLARGLYLKVSESEEAFRMRLLKHLGTAE
jgi:hypothetical protein